MKIKLIAIGNILMGDDAIALYAVERLRERLEAEGIEVTSGETDIDFCLCAAEDADIIFIADSSYTGGAAGDVRLSPINAIDSSLCVSQHDMSLTGLLKYYSGSKKIFTAGIEIESICIQPHLSNKMKSKLEDICNSLYDCIWEALGLLIKA